MGSGEPGDREQQPTTPFNHIVRRVAMAIGGIIVLMVAVSFLTRDPGNTGAVSTTAPIAQPEATAASEGPQVAPIDSCIVLDSESVEKALGLIDDEGRPLPGNYFALSGGESCIWKSQPENGDPVILELGPGTQDDFAPDATADDGSSAIPYPDAGDVGVWFPGVDTGTLSTVTDTDNGYLFVRLSLTRPDLDDHARKQIAGDVMRSAIDRIRFGPSSPVEAQLCDLIDDEDAENLLGPHRDGRPGARDEVFVIGGSAGPVDLTSPGDASCQKLITTEIYVTTANAHDTDFGSEAAIDGVVGEHIDGIGDEAVFFEDLPGTGSFAAPHDTDIMAVRSGDAMFRIIVALPDLSSLQQRQAAVGLAAKALSRITGEAGGIVTVVAEPPADTSTFGYADNLLAREAAGEWTRGEGLVAMLGLFADETPSETVLGDVEMVNDSGTEVIRMARAYAATGPNDATRGEVIRLLDVLGLPPMDLVAAEEEVASPVGLLVARGYGPLAADEDDEPTNSNDVGDRGYAPPPDFPDEESYLPPTDPAVSEECSVVVAPGWTVTSDYSANGGAGKAQILMPETGADQLGWNESHLVYALDAIEASLDVYTPQGVPCLGVVFSSHNAPSSYVLDTLDTQMCGIMLNPPMQQLQEGQFKQRIAREIAHCSIPLAWPDQFGVASYNNRRWWNHALAEFLSNVVYPSVTCSQGRCDMEWLHSGSLSAQELNTPMMHRYDANWAFFQYLWWQSGLGGVVDLISQLPGNGDSVDHEITVAGISGMNEIFHSFAEELSDAGVDDSGGGPVPYNPQASSFQISGEATIQRSVEPFGTKRLHLTITPGSVACIESEPTENILVSYRPGGPGLGGGSWQTLPEDETAFSGEIVVVATNTEAEESFTVKVNKVVDEDECDENEPKDEDGKQGSTNTPADLGCLEICGPSDFYKFHEQLAAWFQSILDSLG